MVYVHTVDRFRLAKIGFICIYFMVLFGWLQWLNPPIERLFNA